MQNDKLSRTERVPMLSESVTISRQFLRSVRIDADFGREDALAGYVCQGTARALLESMARQVRDTQQRAFTWTGPYGGGKSSLALMLCSLVGKAPSPRKRAKQILDLPKDSAIHSSFESSGDGWVVLPLVGKRAKVSDELLSALNATKGKVVKGKTSSKIDVIAELVATAEQHDQGVLVIIDELGKFLEAAAQEGDDVYFFQELAEAASRCKGKLVVVGILHQAFDAYAARLGRQAREDWAKVQGRFVDIPLVAGTDEVIELVSRAITVDPKLNHKEADEYAFTTANAIQLRRPGTPVGTGEVLARCWPLHPVVAALLGPISRRPFSQNERSTFGFLASREPLGFMEFLSGNPTSWASMYGPSRYWDYLCANMEASILASPDGHRWAVAAEAVERAESKGSQVHIEVAKAVALIELFRSGTGLVPELEVLRICVQGASPEAVSIALKDLVSWKILIERKHLGSFGVFAGSDFDIESAIKDARNEMGLPDLQHLSTLTDLQPILAKRLYHETGTMRWFSRRIVRLENVENEARTFQPLNGSVGAFLLCLPSEAGASAGAVARIKATSLAYVGKSLVIGIPENADRIAELSLELVACEQVFKTRPELEGDSVARKELLNRIGIVRSSLEDELSDAFGMSEWVWKGEAQDSSSNSSIAWIASNIAEEIYRCAPKIQNELINRQDPSSNSKKARKDLIYRMVNEESTPNLGYESYPADAGLYYSILKPLGLHRERGKGAWAFGEPYHFDSERMFLLWQETGRFLLKKGSTKKLSDLYDFWSSPPYGLRSGVMPVLAMAFFLSNRSTLALYVDGAFTSDLAEATIDEWLLDPKRISLKQVSASSDQTAYLQAVVSCLPAGLADTTDSKPLGVARALVGLVVGLPNWTRRTTTVSALAQSVRAMLLKANDPHKVLFTDLPTLLNVQSAEDVMLQLQIVTKELVEAYPKVLAEVLSATLQALDQDDGDLASLQVRAKTIKGMAGEFRLEAFISRLENFDGTDAAIEGLISLGSSKPPAQWVDRDVDGALLQLGTWAHEFRRAETLTSMRGRSSNRRAIGVVFMGRKGQEVMATADIDDKDAAKVSKLADRLLVDLGAQPREVALAALAEAGALLFKSLSKESS